MEHCGELAGSISGGAGDRGHLLETCRKFTLGELFILRRERTTGNGRRIDGPLSDHKKKAKTCTNEKRVDRKRSICEGFA